MLSGDKAYELFMSNEPFPLHSFLDEWKEGKIEAKSGYIIAVIGAYNQMVANCDDNRYGKKRAR